LPAHSVTSTVCQPQQLGIRPGLLGMVGGSLAGVGVFTAAQAPYAAAARRPVRRVECTVHCVLCCWSDAVLHAVLVSSVSTVGAPGADRCATLGGLRGSGGGASECILIDACLLFQGGCTVGCSLGAHLVHACVISRVAVSMAGVCAHRNVRGLSCMCATTRVCALSSRCVCAQADCWC
jgi:hypothetical protein